MPEARVAFRLFSSVTSIATGPCLLYGVVLSAKGGNASLVIFNLSATTHAVSYQPVAGGRVLPLYKGAPTGSTQLTFDPPVQLNIGCFASLYGAKGHGIVFYRKRD